MRRIVILVVVAALGAAACGSDGGTDEPATSSTTADSSQAETTTTLATTTTATSSTTTEPEAVGDLASCVVGSWELDSEAFFNDLLATLPPDEQRLAHLSRKTDPFTQRLQGAVRGAPEILDFFYSVALEGVMTQVLCFRAEAGKLLKP